MSSDVVRCSLCDNQMPGDTEVCHICGTPNPFYAIYAGQADSSGASSADDAEVDDTSAALSQDSTATDGDGDYDFSALFIQAEPQGGDAAADDPEPSAGLDLTSLFSWGDDDNQTTPDAEEDRAIETSSVEQAAPVEVAEAEPLVFEAPTAPEEQATDEEQLDAAQEGASPADSPMSEETLPDAAIEAEPLSIEDVAGPAQESQLEEGVSDPPLDLVGGLDTEAAAGVPGVPDVSEELIAVEMGAQTEAESVDALSVEDSREPAQDETALSVAAEIEGSEGERPEAEEVATEVSIFAEAATEQVEEGGSQEGEPGDALLEAEAQDIDTPDMTTEPDDVQVRDTGTSSPGAEPSMEVVTPDQPPDEEPVSAEVELASQEARQAEQEEAVDAAEAQVDIVRDTEGTSPDEDSIGDETEERPVEATGAARPVERVAEPSEVTQQDGVEPDEEPTQAEVAPAYDDNKVDDVVAGDSVEVPDAVEPPQESVPAILTPVVPDDEDISSVGGESAAAVAPEETTVDAVMEDGAVASEMTAAPAQDGADGEADGSTDAVEEDEPVRGDEPAVPVPEMIPSGEEGQEGEQPADTAPYFDYPEADADDQGAPPEPVDVVEAGILGEVAPLEGMESPQTVQSIEEPAQPEVAQPEEEHLADTSEVVVPAHLAEMGQLVESGDSEQEAAQAVETGPDRAEAAIAEPEPVEPLPSISFAEQERDVEVSTLPAAREDEPVEVDATPVDIDPVAVDDAGENVLGEVDQLRDYAPLEDVDSPIEIGSEPPDASLSGAQLDDGAEDTTPQDAAPPEPEPEPFYDLEALFASLPVEEPVVAEAGDVEASEDGVTFYEPPTETFPELPADVAPEQAFQQVEARADTPVGDANGHTSAQVESAPGAYALDATQIKARPLAGGSGLQEPAPSEAETQGVFIPDPAEPEPQPVVAEPADTGRDATVEPQPEPDYPSTSAQAQSVQESAAATPEAQPQAQSPLRNYLFGAKAAQPQFLDPQSWAPPPPPPPPTPYGAPPLRAAETENLWPTYAPPAPVKAVQAPEQEPVLPVETPTGSQVAAPVETPVEAPVETQVSVPIEKPVEASIEEAPPYVSEQTLPEPFQPPSAEVTAIQEVVPVEAAGVEQIAEDYQPQAVVTESVEQAEEALPTPAPVEEPFTQPPPPAQNADGSLDLSAFFDQIEIDTSERPIPKPFVAATEQAPVEAPPEATAPAETPVQAETATPARPQTVMPITITPNSSSQPTLGGGVSPYDANAWQAFSGMGGGSGKANQQQQPPPQEQVSWQQFAQTGAPDPYATGVGPTEQPGEQAWQPDSGMPRPQRGTPEYDAMVRAALAQRGVSYTSPASTPQAQPQQQPQAQPSWQPQPGQPRPKPGTPEYDEMVRAALAQRGIGTGPLSSQPSQPYQSPQPQAQSQAGWQPGQPRPQPGTPEYDEMVRQALAQRGISTGPLSSPPSSQGQSSQASSYDSNKPRPKPGTPEYEEMVRQALNERREREGR